MSDDKTAKYEKPIKLDMTFDQALQMIAKGGKPPTKAKPAIVKPVIKKRAKPKPSAYSPRRLR